MATVRIPGPRLRQLQVAEVRYSNTVMQAVRRTIARVTEQLDPIDPVGSAGVTTDLWREEVAQLSAELGEVWTDAARDTRAHLQQAANARAQRGTTAGALPSVEVVPEVDDDAIEVLEVPDDVGTAYLSERENYLVGIGDVLWAVIRDELIAGVAEGEGIPELSARLTQAAALTAGRATRIARTEVVGAANAGSLAQMQAFAPTATKEWIATDDTRTRPDHEDADGQTVQLNEPFVVGGVPMQRPHDPLGGPEQVVNCRCTLSYDIPEEELVPDELGLVAAVETPHTGAMVALIPTEADLDRLVVTGGEPRDELHLTLFFLGLAADLDESTQQGLEVALREVAAREGVTPLTGRAFGVNYWNPASDDPALVLAVGDTDGELTLEGLRQQVRDALVEQVAGFDELLPAQHTPWVPHVTLAYGATPERVSEFTELLGNITFDRIRLALGPDTVDVPIGAAAATMASAGGDVMTAELTETAASGDLTFANPVGWHGVLAVEGIETGDGREFAPESLTWPDLPIPLRRNIEDSHGGEMTTTAVLVGRIDEIERDGNKLTGRGVFDMGGEHGREAARLVREGFLKGVSVDVDSIKDADVELIMPDDEDDDLEDEDSDEGVILKLFTPPEKVIFHAGRVRAATLVDIPAFVEAFISIDDETDVAEGELGLAAALVTTQFGAVGTHDTATSDGPWDGAANEKRLESPLSVETARNVYAWIEDGAVEDGELPKSAAKFPHHEVSEDGSPGAANLTACSAGIAALNGARGGTDIPAADRQGVWNHLAAHLRDGGQEPPPLQLEADTVTASAELDDLPPREWFNDPKLSLPTPIIVTDDGRVYGHAAMWGACHVGFADTCVSPPHEDSHPYYLTGEVACADGSRVAVGQLTVGTGHAPLHVAASRAAEHYDNTGTAVADVCVGNDEHGIWVAGAVRPDASAARVRDLRAAGQVSGDWRRIGGELRLVGLLAVNVPGFPVPKTRARVASGAPLALVAAGKPTIQRAVSEAELDQRALRLMRDRLMQRIIGGR